jgi:hypothetical protein
LDSHYEDEEGTELVHIADAESELEASMVVGRLESAGIGSVVNPPLGTPGPTFEIKRAVLVRPEDAARAGELLADGG